MRALEKEPSRRYQTAAAMSQALESVAAWLEHSDRSDPASDLYSEGVDAFDRGQWGLAVDRLSRLAELDPGNDDVLSLLQAAQQAGSTDSELTQR
jgi:Flp pilus assembly protein TadD